MASSPGDDRIVVGIDFGTTFSGIAFAFSADPDLPDDITVVKNWPGSNNVTAEKVPSEMVYMADSTGSTRRAKRRKLHRTADPSTGVSHPALIWGYQIRPDQNKLQCLKLLLDPRQQLPAYASKEDLKLQLRQCGKTVFQAVTDYLSVLHNEAREAIIRRYGERMVADTKIQTVLTVPAIWSDVAKNLMLQAAEDAGLGEYIMMISEPEAAATYALKSMEHHLLTAGDNFIVCDAGGGTVDLISYEVKSMLPLRIEESAPGTGDLAGSVFLNMRFRNLVKERMGSDSFEEMLDQNPRSWTVAMGYFEDYVKRTFDPAKCILDHDTTRFNVPLPGAVDNVEAGIAHGFIALSIADVAEIFRPMIDIVIENIERQRSILAAFDKVAKGVILVGGFGQSNYLYRSLRTRFAEEDPPPPYTQSRTSPEDLETIRSRPRFIILQPANAWTAIVRGAVLNGVDQGQLEVGRKARCHYGVLCEEPYDADSHSASNRFWNPIKEEFWAENQISWYVERAQALISEQPILLSFDQCRECGQYTHHLRVQLVVSHKDEAPDEYDEEGDEARVLCRIKVDATEIPEECWKQKRTRSGKAYEALSIQVGMTIGSGRICFDYRVDDVVYGRVRGHFN